MKHSKFLLAAIFSALISMAMPAALRAETADRASMPAPLDGNALAATSGLGESQAVVNSDVTGNSMGDVGYTGSISGVTASNNSGMTTMITNTGNQVSISTATNVNVFYH